MLKENKIVTLIQIKINLLKISFNPFTEATGTRERESVKLLDL